MEERRPNLKLRNARVSRNWTQQDVADKIGTVALTVGRWERGETFPSADYRQRLCDLFMMKPEDLGLREEDYMFPPISETRETEQEAQVPDEMSLPERQKGLVSNPLLFAGIVFALLLIASAITYALHLASPSTIIPGGGWISPTDSMVHSQITFAAYAYPTHEGDPAIDHVNFTLYWQGVDPRRWVIGCVARKALKPDIFSCTVDLHALGAPTGTIRISFDVYDRQGNHNNAPNGTRTVIYFP